VELLIQRPPPPAGARAEAGAPSREAAPDALRAAGAWLRVDAILLQLGFKTALAPLKEWDLEISKGAIVVDEVMKTNLPQV